MTQDEEDKEVTYQIPNGGYGWVIVGCSFLIHMMVVGNIFCLSVLYVSWLDYFQTGKGVTSWVISLALALMCVTGPLPGALSKRFTDRVIVIAGGLTMAFGFLISSLASNLYMLFVSVGLIVGVGAGCCYLPSVSMVAMYFTSKRSVAMGIASSGVGVGTFFLAPLFNLLVEEYGWRGCMLILSGISLNLCVLGALMRPLELKSISESEYSVIDYERCEVENVPMLTRNGSNDCDAKITMYPYSNDSKSVVSSYEFVLDNNPELTTTEATNQRTTTTIYRRPRIMLGQDGLDIDSTSEHPSATQNSTFGEKRRNLEKLKDKEMNPTFNAEYRLELLPDWKKNLSLFQKQDLNKDCKPGLGRSMQQLNTESHYENARKLYSSEKELRRSFSFQSSQTALDNRVDIASLTDMQIMMAGNICNVVRIHHTFQSMRSVHGASSVDVAVSSSANLPIQTTANVDYGGTTLDKAGRLEACENVDDNINVTPYSCRFIVESLKSYWKLLRNVTCFVYCLSNFLTNLSFFMPVLYMVDRAVDSG